MQVNKLVDLACREIDWDDRLFTTGLEISFSLFDHVLEELYFFRSADDWLYTLPWAGKCATWSLRLVSRSCRESRGSILQYNSWLPDLWLDLVEDLQLDIAIIELFEVVHLDVVEGSVDPLDDALFHARVYELLLSKIKLISKQWPLAHDAAIIQRRHIFLVQKTRWSTTCAFGRHSVWKLLCLTSGTWTIRFAIEQAAVVLRIRYGGIWRRVTRRI